MLLVIDIGNSNIVCGLFDNNQWIEQFRMHTEAKKTEDEYEVIFRTLLNSRKIPPKQIQKIVISSVVPSLTNSISKMVMNLTEINPLIINPAIYPKLDICISTPYDIGTDLVANAVAAHKKYMDNCIVVDFGTALSFTVIQSNGNLLGVTIAPGLETAMESLSNKTAQLPHVELSAPHSFIGKNTVHAMQAGVVLGYRGLIESLVEGITSELQGPTQVVATGGLASVIYPITKCFTAIEPSLTLDGLRIIGNTF